MIMQDEYLYIGEIWRSVVGYNGKYMVSTLGRVRNKKGDILKPYPNRCGYLRVGLYNNGVYHREFVHRLVAEAYLPNSLNLPIVNHKNEDKEDNRLENLEWVTEKYNLNYGTLNKRKSLSIKNKIAFKNIYKKK